MTNTRTETATQAGHATVESHKAHDDAHRTAVVATRYGRVRGSITDGISSFKGIPYAAPPFGANRLRPPQPVAPWDGVRDALTFGPKIPQPLYPPPVQAVLPPEACTTGRDCLNLNIWSPALGRTNLPVMVWIPGGVYGYHGTGASPCYDGRHFARDGVICVTINYRVAADGFLYLGEGNANRGLLDQVAALEWVRKNIAAFGGDPGKVTVFGESAGGMSVATLLSMPRADGLFRRAIAQSGATHYEISVASAQRVRERLAEQLGCEPSRDAFADVPTERLLAAQLALRADLAARPDPQRWGQEVVVSGMPWHPVIDGDVIPGRPIDRIAAGASADIDLMVGSNSDEWRLFLVSYGVIGHVTDTDLAGAAAAYGLPVEAALRAYRAARPNATAGDLLAALQSDWYVRIPAIRLAEARTSGPGATYMYEFAWRSQAFGGLLGACHGLEVPFVFDMLGKGMDFLLGPDPPQRLADAMHGAWVAFASRGNPGWPAYELPRRATMRFDATSEVVVDPRSADLALWKGVR